MEFVVTDANSECWQPITNLKLINCNPTYTPKHYYRRETRTLKYTSNTPHIHYIHSLPTYLPTKQEISSGHKHKRQYRRQTVLHPIKSANPESI